MTQQEAEKDFREYESLRESDKRERNYEEDLDNHYDIKEVVYED